MGFLWATRNILSARLCSDGAMDVFRIGPMAFSNVIRAQDCAVSIKSEDEQ